MLLLPFLRCSEMVASLSCADTQSPGRDGIDAAEGAAAGRSSLVLVNFAGAEKGEQGACTVALGACARDRQSHPRCTLCNTKSYTIIVPEWPTALTGASRCECAGG